RAQALANNHIPEAVYDQLVETVNNNLHLLHRYTELRKELLGLDELKMYDIYTPLVNEELKMTYEEAQEWMVKALQPLGDEYVSIAKEGSHYRRLERCENYGTRSGAYSSGT